MQKFGVYSLNPTQRESEQQGSPFIPVRVVHIILDNKDPEWQKYGGWDSLGLIKFVPAYSEIGSNEESVNIAKPLFPNIKQYPLKYELTWVIQLPDPSTAGNPNFSSFYYINSINLWNHPHHNAFPAIDFKNLPENQQLNYQEINSGLAKQEADKNKEFKLGETFKEKSNIKPLLPFEGDIIYEGRWGQSIRFGSTVLNRNSWSSTGSMGDPITIIRNGQNPKVSDPKKGWIPTVEDINGDNTSIWFTSNQKIPINVASTNLKSFDSLFPRVESFSTKLPDNPPIPKTQSVASKDQNLSSSKDQNVPSTQVTSSTNQPSIKPDPSKVYKEDEIIFNFPGEDTQEFIFQVESEEEESNDLAVSPVKYDAKILQSESPNTKNGDGNYAAYNNGTAEYGKIIYVEQIRVLEKHAPKVKLILDAARKDGITLKITSGFRTWDEQVFLRKKNIKDKSKIEDQNFIETAHSSEFKPVTGKPGYSAHQKGTAYDFNTATPGVYAWMVKNAAKFGFVRTVSSERWHWEYIPNADPFTYVKKDHESWDNLV